MRGSIARGQHVDDSHICSAAINAGTSDGGTGAIVRGVGRGAVGPKNKDGQALTKGQLQDFFENSIPCFRIFDQCRGGHDI